MDLNNKKSKLSFSIENILRDDFSTRPRKDVPTQIPSMHSSFVKWPNIPVYRLCAVRYNPMFVQVLPRWQYAAGTKLNNMKTEDQQTFQEQQRNIGEDISCSACEDPKGEDERNENKAKVESKSEKCLKVKTSERKRRHRSHFTQRQLQYLDKIFSRQQYLTRDERTLLARGLEMTELQIRNWFQNRRYQRKHRENKDTKPDEKGSPSSVRSED